MNIEQDLAVLKSDLGELENALLSDDEEKWEAAKAHASEMIQLLEGIIDRIDEGGYS